MGLAERFGFTQDDAGNFGQGALARRFGFGAEDEWEERGILLVNKRTGETKPKPITGGQLAVTPEKRPGFLGTVERSANRLATSAYEGLLSTVEQTPFATVARLGKAAGTLAGTGVKRGPLGIPLIDRDVIEAYQETPLPAAPREEARSAYRRAKERFAEVPLPPVASAAASTALEVAGQTLADPTIALGGVGAKGALQRPSGARSLPTPTRTLPDDLIGLQRASLSIGEAAPSGRVPVQEIVREGNKLTAKSAAGEVLGEMDLLPEPGDGFRVGVVTTGKRGSGVGRALMQRAAEETQGPYRGTAAMTPEGEGFMSRLRETDPGLFRESQNPLFARPELSATDSTSSQSGFVRGGGLGRWLEENLASGGPFKAAAREFPAAPQQEFVRGIPKEIEGMQGAVARRVEEAHFAIKDLEAAVSAATPNKDAAAQMFKDLYRVRLREKRWSDVPEEVRPAARALFKLVDRTSVEMRDAGALPPSLQDVVTRRLGRYLHRGYEAFDNPRFREKMEGTEAWREAEGFLRGELPDAQPDEIQGILNALTDREQGLRKFLVTGGAPTRVNAILQKRQAIPAPLRRVMGEYEDIRQVAESTVANMAYDLETYKLLRGLKDKGEALGVFRETGKPTGEVYRKILGAEVGNFGDRSPLNEMLTTPGLKKALVGTFEEVKYTTWNKAAGWVKAAKTVGSIQTHARNFLSHTITSTANGRNPVNPARWQQVAQAMQDRPQRLRAIELGIMGEGASSREIADYLKMIDNPASPALVRGAVRGGKALQRLYKLEDDLWRMYNWLGETEDMLRVGLPLDQAQARAADRVRDTFQTYSRAPQIAEKLRRNPLVGAFPTFYIESVRNVKNIAKIGAQDLAEGLRTGNGELVKLGMRRFLGLVAGATAATGLGTLGRAKTGLTDEQEAAFRRQVAPHYARNAELIFTDYVPGEEMTAFDFSFMNPYSGLSKSAVATLRAIDEGRVPVEAATEFLEQVAGTEILAGAAFELVANRRLEDTIPPRVGGPVYPTDMGPAAFGREAGYHAYRSLAPGAVLTGENIARGLEGEEWVPEPVKGFLPPAKVSSGVTRKLGTEALAVVGPRVTTWNIETAIQRRIRDIGDRYGRVSGTTKREAERLGPQERVARDYVAGTAKLWTELDQVVRDAKTLEVPEKALIGAMRDARLNRWFGSAFLGGRMPPVPPGIEVDPDTYRLIQQAYSQRRAR